MVMTRLGRIMVTILIAAWPAAAAPPNSSQADLVVAGQGATSDGESMTVRCELDLVVALSNLFVGRCLVEVGPDRLVLEDLAFDGTAPIEVVLDGHLIVRGGAVTATGRFQEFLQSSQSVFPVYVEVDPLGRSWAVRGHRGSGDVETVAGGQVTEGAVHFRLRRSLEEAHSAPGYE